jgi:heme-degrading monooxygenase HmoA
MSFIEILTFRLRAGVAAEAFISENRRVQEEVVARQPGFLSRELARGEEGEWLVVVRWESRAHSAASMEAFGASPHTSDFLEMIDGSSYVAKVFETLA